MARLTPSKRSQQRLANINGRVLTWAIARSGLSRDKIANKLRVKVEQVEGWEGGVPPQLDQAELLADLLAVPYGYFFMSAPPADEVAIPDLRRRESSKPLTVDLHSMLGDAMVRQDWYRDFAKDHSTQKLDFIGRFDLSARHEDVAASIRKTLSIDLQLRRAARSHSDYLAFLCERAERAGILVMRSRMVGNNSHRRVPSDVFQGFALADSVAPVILINTSDYEAAQIFTFAHELSHIWIGQSAISRPDNWQPSKNRIESFCNSVAAETLLPSTELRLAWKLLAGIDGRVSILARRYWISSLVVLRKARDLKLVSQDEYFRLRSKEIDAIKPKRNADFGMFWSGVSSRASHRLTDAVIGEVQSGRIVMDYAGRLLGVAPGTLARFAGKQG